MRRFILENWTFSKDKDHPHARKAEFLCKGFWKSARVVMPRGKISVQLRLDSDVVERFKTHGKVHLARMNAVLKAYVDAQNRS